MGYDLYLWKLKPKTTLAKVRRVLDEWEPDGDEDDDGPPPFADKTCEPDQIRKLLTPAFSRHFLTPEKCPPTLADWLKNQTGYSMAEELIPTAIEALGETLGAMTPGELFLQTGLKRSPLEIYPEMFKAITDMGFAVFDPEEDILFGHKPGKKKVNRTPDDPKLTPPADKLVPKILAKMSPPQQQAASQKLMMVMVRAQMQLSRSLTIGEHSGVWLLILGKVDEGKKILRKEFETSTTNDHPDFDAYINWIETQLPK